MTRIEPVTETADCIPIVLFGSGEFAVGPFELLRARLPELGVTIVQVISQPDRKAGRGRESLATPVSVWAIAHGIPLLRTPDVNEPATLEMIRQLDARLFVVIAFGQKMSDALLENVAAINLHGSILPRWRGAAPIQRSVMAGDAKVGVSVIGLSERMDAGSVFATAQTDLIPTETAGDLHDRLSTLGAIPLFETVARWVSAFRAEATSSQSRSTRSCRALEALGGETQDESLATRARKLSRADAWVDFTCSAGEVCARINGLSPWPGVDAMIGSEPARLLRARVAEANPSIRAIPGEVGADGLVGCGTGSIELLEVQAPGSRVTSLGAFMNGRRMSMGIRIESNHPNHPNHPNSVGGGGAP